MSRECFFFEIPAAEAAKQEHKKKRGGGTEQNSNPNIYKCSLFIFGRRHDLPTFSGVTCCGKESKKEGAGSTSPDNSGDNHVASSCFETFGTLSERIGILVLSEPAVNSFHRVFFYGAPAKNTFVGVHVHTQQKIKRNSIVFAR